MNNAFFSLGGTYMGESGGVVGVVSVCCCFMNCFMNDNKIVKVRKQDRVLSKEEN